MKCQGWGPHRGCAQRATRDGRAGRLPDRPASHVPSGPLSLSAPAGQVDQLHIHVTGRTKEDPSWPGPCYGAVPAVPLAADALDEAVQKLRAALSAKHALFTAVSST